MNETMRVALEAGMAALPRVVDAPTGELGYGTDISCRGDLDPGVDVTGIELLGQALARRLDTPRGGLVDDPDYGYDLRSELNKGTTKRDVDAVAGRIVAELTKDDRVSSVRATVTPAPDGSSMRVAIRVVPWGELGPFDMVLSVTSAAVLLEAVRQ